MCLLRRVAHLFRKQGYCHGLLRVSCAKPGMGSDFREDKASLYYPAQIRSRGFLSKTGFYDSPPICRKHFVGSRGLGSLMSEKGVDDNDNAGDSFLNLETHASADVIEESNVVEENGEEMVSEAGFLHDGSDAEKDVSSHEHLKTRDSLELFNTMVDASKSSLPRILDKWAGERNDLSRIETSKIIVGLRKRRMYGKALQFSKWLETTKHFDLTERDCASRLDLIAKTQGVLEAEKYLENIPESFKGEIAYRTLLANFVHIVNMEKAEVIFRKMREIGLPISIYACNQMILLYKRCDKSKIADILSLMEKENVQASLLTYKLLIDTKGESNDILGMEKLVDTMKADGMQPDINVLSILARHYVSGGLMDKVFTILKEIEEGKQKESVGARSALLSLYAYLDNADEVGRIWKYCKLEPTIKECLSAITAWGKLGKIKEAEEVFELMLQKWKKLSPKHYSLLMSVYIQNNLTSKGTELIKGMAKSGGWIGPLAWDGLVRLYVRAGDVEKADSILHKAAQQNRS
ncbi:Pentatricopeptide repeat-containing protein, mitochondrial [Quillaja saponaria]|uniref:Pentatricopeptide repeat-containing protein, mitochondrial n=1 Tax=Quillaja saponaria TaxID=32244 RepID=A0AAD7L0Y7_QUISA|nr:Pentatricopeptide repeat-containing protein, mitochondrial [Quillaja saponaria]